jgi:LacI family transcriptional regulator
VATIKEVAKKAHVSVGTVSNVLSGAVPVSKRLRERVLEAVQQLDYHPNHVARSLKIRQTKTIGMLVSDVANPFIPQLIRGAEDAAWREQYMLIIFNSDDQPDREGQLLEALRSRQVDGILLVASGRPDSTHIAALKGSRLPVICLARELPGLDLDCVIADNATAAYDCVKHLIGLGHRDIGFILGDTEVTTALDKSVGYRRALGEAGIEPNPALIVSSPGFRDTDGYRAGVQLLEMQSRPTAVIAANSMLAIGFLRAMKEMQLSCPDQVALIAFEDPIFSDVLRPSLTTVALPTYEIGSRGVELLLKRIHDPSREPSRIVLPTKLVIRESAGRPFAAASDIAQV